MFRFPESLVFLTLFSDGLFRYLRGKERDLDKKRHDEPHGPLRGGRIKIRCLRPHFYLLSSPAVKGEVTPGNSPLQYPEI